MTSEFEAAFRQLLKSVVREVADEVHRERQDQESATRSQQRDPDDRLLLSASEAAKRLAISPRSLYQITVEGLLPCVRVGRSVRYSVETIKQWHDRGEALRGGKRAGVAVPQLHLFKDHCQEVRYRS